MKHELREVVLAPHMTTMTHVRRHAVRAFGYVGTEEDLLFLEQLSQEDPLEVVDFGGPVFEMVKGQYVNTGPRMPAIRPKDDPTWKHARRSFPIRGAADRAIRRIEERLQTESPEKPGEQ